MSLLNIFNKFDVNIHSIFGPKKPSFPEDIQCVLDRFQTLLDGYQINRAQFLRLVPNEWNWGMETLSTPKDLLKALNHDKIQHLANIFGIRKEWLSGDGNRIYDWALGYKQPTRFAASLAEQGWLIDGLRMVILSTSYQTGRDGSLGEFTAVFLRPIAEWDNGEKVIYQYMNFGNSPLDWAHKPCIFDILALGRWFNCDVTRHSWIPIIPVPTGVVEKVAEGTQFPGPFIPEAYGRFDHFEDRLLYYGNPFEGQGESLSAKPDKNLDQAMKYYRESGLRKIKKG